MPNTVMSMASRTAIVTGSGRNIGRATALLLAEAGARVVVNGHADRDRIEAVANEIRSSGGEAIAVLADVSRPEDVDRLVAETIAAFGSADVLVSNVAVRPYQSFLEISLDDWEHVIRTNLTSAYLLSRAVLPHMIEKRFGRLIYMSGDDGFFGNVTHRVHNVAAKSALHGMAKALAREFGEYNVTANSIAPGLIDTERDWTQYAHVDRDPHPAAVALRRWGTSEEVAGACLFLASDAGSYVTGHLIHVNGGSHMY
jgi:3-oxoacyl-[acyl-carrier protein] reductase